MNQKANEHVINFNPVKINAPIIKATINNKTFAKDQIILILKPQIIHKAVPIINSPKASG